MTTNLPEPYQTPVQAGQILDLNWRNGPDVLEMFRRAWNFAVDVDYHGRSIMIASTGMSGRQRARLRKGDKAQTIVNRGAQLVYRDKDGQPISEEEASKSSDFYRAWTYEAYLSTRKGNSLFKYARVWRKMVKILDKGMPECKRTVGYDLNSGTFPKAAGLRCYQDLCLTMGVHPSAFGIHADGDGAVFVPHGFKISVTVCANVFAYLGSGDNQESEGVDAYTRRGLIHRTYRGQTDHIHAMIERLEVCVTNANTGVAPRAIIVTEHRNIKQMLANAAQGREKQNWEGVFVVMTGGMPSLATREFLHMLGKEKLLADVPILWISDHDVHAMEIFSVLKHGSRSSAFASSTTVCPRLKWAGVSIDRYKALALAWPDWELKKRTQGRQMQESDKKDLLKVLKEEMHRRLFKPLNTSSAYLNTSDINILKHFHSYRVFCPVADSELYKDLQKMGMNPYGHELAVREDARGYKFSLAKLGDPSTYGIETCVLTIMKQYKVKGAINSQVGLPDISAKQLQWLAAESQFRPEPGTSQVGSSEDWGELLDEEAVGNLAIDETSSEEGDMYD